MFAIQAGGFDFFNSGERHKKGRLSGSLSEYYNWN